MGVDVRVSFNKQGDIFCFFLRKSNFSMNVKSPLYRINLKKKYFNHAEIFILKLFTMVTNPTECSGIEHGILIKSLADEGNL